MRVQPKRSNKKSLFISIIIILVIAGGVATYLLFTYPTSTHTSDTQKTIDSDSQDTTDTETIDSTQNQQDAPTKVEDKTPIQYEGEQTNDEPTTDNERFRIPEDD